MPARIAKSVVENGPDFMAGLSGGTVVLTWLAPINDALQLVATGVAIVAGVYAVKWHKLRIKDMKRKLDSIDKNVKQVKKELKNEDESK